MVMTIKTFYINQDETAFVTAYMLDNISQLQFCEKRPGIIVFPGGGYEFCCDREGEPIALHYLAQGYNAFVVNYTCNAHFPAPLIDAANALYEIRMRAEEFGVDRNKLAVLGCSAGGHLAGCLATMWSDEQITNAIGCEPNDLRPNAVVLCYPVISGVTAPHESSFRVLLGENASHSELSRLSLENRVTPQTPPVFIWATANDDCVPAHNSLVMAKACISNKVPVELHMYDEGPHGLATCDKATGWNEMFYIDNCRRWIGLSIEFLNKHMGV